MAKPQLPEGVLVTTLEIPPAPQSDNSVPSSQVTISATGTTTTTSMQPMTHEASFRAASGKIILKTTHTDGHPVDRLTSHFPASATYKANTDGSKHGKNGRCSSPEPSTTRENSPTAENEGTQPKRLKYSARRGSPFPRGPPGTNKTNGVRDEDADRFILHASEEDI